MAREKKNSRRAKGDGTVYQLKNGIWRAQATVGYKKDGKPKKVTRSAKTKSEAIALLRQITIQWLPRQNAIFNEASGMRVGKKI